ncbi:HD domain-containing protein [Jeongeupia naejangsanensis]|uniref:5'-deoxynucleotidase n=1 Tax=Jeongeupia naejangsanensis TaxID=613195 RepID=A0ABS2BNS4_9NEIS|nr:HD domain-containing protein [Jeongeupia naejangsanensis]MBM3117282.1 HD domain-containing protein [Jeongeupia naejangsanensis]
MAERLDAIFAFALELEKLKGILRRNKPIGLDRRENTAEHSWQIAMLAMTLAPEAVRPVNVDRVLKMLLVHDIPEIDAGDVMVYDAAQRQAAEALELAGAERIFGLLPDDTGKALFALWHDFSHGDDDDARFARAIDRVMPMLQNLNNGGQSWREHGIRVSQVVAMNQPKVEPVLPGVWAKLRAGLDDAIARGDLQP